MSDDVQLMLVNVSHDAEESVVRSVAFGPAVDTFAFLLEVDPESGAMAVTIGNGPADADVPNTIPAVLREVAGIIESLGDNPVYWASLSDTE